MKTFTHFNLFVFIFCMFVYKETSSQGTGYQCCGLYQLDSDGSVFIETIRPLLPPNSGNQVTFQAVRFRVCNTNPIAIQLWTCTADMTSCVFKWQTVVTPTSNQISGDNITVKFDSAVTVTASDRLGLFSPYNASMALSIPYGMDASLAFLYESSNMYTDSSKFISGLNISMSQTWRPRSFARSIVFCKNADCNEISSQALAPIAPQRENPNQPPPNTCCVNQASCDMSSLNDPMANQTQTIQALQNEIDDLNKLISSMIGNPVTGTCPTGFTSGPYGIGSCFFLYRSAAVFATADFFCRDQFKAGLLRINSQQEQDFIMNFIVNGAIGNESYWLTAMYDFRYDDWFWMDDLGKTINPISYSNWQNGIKPTPILPSDMCSSLFVDKTNKANMWIETDCSSSNYFICELPKTCF